MDHVRAPAVAGIFYPGNSRQLREMLMEMLTPNPQDAPLPKAIIVPHAGYIYSGPVAASAYNLVRQGRDVYSRVILLGPAHHVPFQGLAASSAAGFATPLGVVEMDRAAATAIQHLPQVQVLDEAHVQEHALEVQLPFLQMVLSRFRILPLLAGDATAHDVNAVLSAVWGGPETLIVISTDLSHYHDYATAQTMDHATSTAIAATQADVIDDTHACGCRSVNGLMLAARQHGLKGQILDVRNSGDTAGMRDRVVGYGAFAFH